MWLVPAVAGAVIWAAFTNVDTRKFCIAAGVVTFAALMWGFSQLQGDLFKVLSIGAWLSLLLGGALLLFGIGVIGPTNQNKIAN